MSGAVRPEPLHSICYTQKNREREIKAYDLYLNYKYEL